MMLVSFLSIFHTLHQSWYGLLLTFSQSLVVQSKQLNQYFQDFFCMPLKNLFRQILCSLVYTIQDIPLSFLLKYCYRNVNVIIMSKIDNVAIYFCYEAKSHGKLWIKNFLNKYDSFLDRPINKMAGKVIDEIQNVSYLVKTTACYVSIRRDLSWKSFLKNIPFDKWTYIMYI